MDKEELPEHTRKNIDSILEQLKGALTLPPSPLFLEATEFAIEIFVERNVWNVLVSLDGVFFNLIEFIRTSGSEKNYSEELRRCYLFESLFLKKYQRGYSRFHGIFINDREKYISQFEPGTDTPSLTIDEDAQDLFDRAAYLAAEVFGSEKIQGDHLILSLFYPRRISREFFIAIGLVKEEFLLEWVKSLDLSVEELERWERAFNFIECEVNLNSIIKEMEAGTSRDTEAKTIDEVVNIDNVVDFDSLEEESQGKETESEFSEKAEGILEAEMPGDDGVVDISEGEEGTKEKKKEASEEEAVTSLVIPREELGRAPARADEPTSKLEDDLLGRKHLVEALAEMIADENQGTPFTIGLLGHWGAGKSTVMKMLKDVLNPDNPDHKNFKFRDRFLFAEFNAWEYERTNNLEAGLAQEVVRSLVEPLGVKEKGRLRVEFALREHGPKALILVAGLGLILLALLGDFVWVASNLVEEGRKDLLVETLFGGGLVFVFLKFWGYCKKLYEHPLSVELRTYLKLPSYGEHLGLIPVLKRHIKTLCKIRLGTAAERNEWREQTLGKWNQHIFNFLFNEEQERELELSRRLVVFIDDLDRCDPKSITKTLDAVRLVMDVKNVIVIIGIDHRIAFRAVGDHYKDLADSKHSRQDIARDYLGKILQLVIMLNQPQAKELKEFVSQGLFPNVEKIVEEKGSGGEQEYLSDVPEEKAKGDPVPKPLVDNEDQTSETLNVRKSLVLPSGTAKFFIEAESKKKADDEPNLWREEIKFSTEERDLFGELAVVFEFSNPRQLLRLRNSYGLLKLLYGMHGAIPFTPHYGKMDSGEAKPKLMILLFWKEFEANHPKWAMQFKEASVNSRPEPIVSRIANWLSGSDIGGLDFSLSGLTAMASFVERFVLPRGEEGGSEDAKGVMNEPER